MKSDKEIFPSTLDALPSVLVWVRRHLAETPLDEKEQKKIELALEEAVVNVVKHGLGEGNGEIALHCRIQTNRQIEFDLYDKGPLFNPLAHQQPIDTEAPLEDRNVGGLGLHLIHSCMDAVFYRREESQNILTLVKKLSSD